MRSHITADEGDGADVLKYRSGAGKVIRGGEDNYRAVMRRTGGGEAGRAGDASSVERDMSRSRGLIRKKLVLVMLACELEGIEVKPGLRAR